MNSGGNESNWDKFLNIAFGGAFGLGTSSFANFGKNGYSAGGYTGDGGKFEPKGVVHGGEFVFTQEATKRIGVDRLALEHQNALQGYAGGGFVGSFSSGGSSGMSGGVMQLSPEDRNLIAGISQRPVFLIADGKIIGQLVQSGNVGTSRSV